MRLAKRFKRKGFELIDTHNLLVFRFGCKVTQNFRHFQIFLAENYFTRSVRKNNANFSCKYGKLYIPLQPRNRKQDWYGKRKTNGNDILVYTEKRTHPTSPAVTTILPESKTNNMKKNVIKLNENTLRQIVAESVKKIPKEHAWASASTFKELQIVLDKVTGILRKFSNNIPQEHSDEFMKLVGREWNALWESLSSIEESVMHINNPRGLSDGDLTFDDLS